MKLPKVGTLKTGKGRKEVAIIAKAHQPVERFDDRCHQFFQAQLRALALPAHQPYHLLLSASRREWRARLSMGSEVAAVIIGLLAIATLHGQEPDQLVGGCQVR